MKYLIVLLFIPCLSYGQTFIEKIPPKNECAGCVVETEISKDTIWVAEKQYSNENHTVSVFTKDNLICSNDSVFISKIDGKIYYWTGLFNKGKWVFPMNKDWEKAFTKSAKAIQKWQLAVIKEKYPAYYAKWFKK